jgi:hypothetical protein
VTGGDIVVIHKSYIYIGHLKLSPAQSLSCSVAGGWGRPGCNYRLDAPPPAGNRHFSGAHNISARCRYPDLWKATVGELDH